MRISQSGRQAVRTRSQSRKFQGFNKAWDVGDKLSVFFPIFWCPDFDEDGNKIMVQETNSHGKPVFDDAGQPVMTERGQWDIVTANIWGHDITNFKKFPVGGSFIPSLTDVVRGQPAKILLDENGSPMYDSYGEVMYEPIPGDVTYQFSKIAPLFIKGEKQAEIDRIMKKKFASEDLRREALNEVDRQYNTDENMDAPRPIIGKLHMVISTEVVVVKHDTAGGYNLEASGQFTYKLSDDKFNSIIALLDDFKFKPRDLKARWFEVQITFNGTSNDKQGRAAAGRKATPVGLTPEYTMEARDPEAYKKLKSRLETLPQDSQTISCRNYMYTKIEEKTIQRCITSYVALHSDMLDHISRDEDKDMLYNNAYRLVQFKALDNMENKEIIDKIQESYREYLEKHPDLKPDDSGLATEQEGYHEPTFEAMPTSRELLSGDAGITLPGEDEVDNNTDLTGMDTVI